MSLFALSLGGLVLLAFYAIYIDYEVTRKFEGSRWEVPSRVYARPLELYPGKVLSKQDLLLELKKLRYKNRQLTQPGSYYKRSKAIYLHSRHFAFPDEEIPAARLKISFSGNRIKTIRNLDSNDKLDLWRLEPVFIGGIYPRLHEDRVLVRLEQVPAALVNTLLAVEDKHFREHHGIAPLSILRALIANIRAGRKVQGGSTLTQQLVKNFYLTSEKTLARKINEAIMALLLELHYSKDEILEAYLNEVYLGQDGNRAIHGFGLAAQFYFDTDLTNLNEAQIALLVGLVKGASYYDPRRHPERALKRRQLVQALQFQEGLISAKKYRRQRNLPLGVNKDKPSGISPYPYFLDLVKRQLRRDYAPKDLQTAGLKLFTTLDPVLQHKTEKSIRSQLQKIEKAKHLPPNSIQVAAAISEPDTGLVRALVGGRNFRVNGFNRALDSSRQIGSLIKPVVYLTAIQKPAVYRLNTVIQDAPISIRLEDGRNWVPKNYDKRYHGDISLLGALVNSYNAAAVRLGLQVGVDAVVKNLYKLGVKRELSGYPSLLLGAVELSLFDVMQVYQTLASQGFKTPLRAISMVSKDNGEVLSRYPPEVEQSIDAAHAYLVLHAMQEVMRKGTGKSFYQRFPYTFTAAGKTGTTNDYRDSWFAGFTGNKLAVVWLGRDDNQPMGLSGSSGALRIWTDIMARTHSMPFKPVSPPGIEFIEVNLLMNNKGQVECEEDYPMPVIVEHLPNEQERIVCTP